MRNLQFFESSMQRPSYGLESLNYVICEPNAAQITVRCLHLSNMLHHQNKDLLKSEKALSRLLLSLASCTSEKQGVCVCVARYRMKLIYQILKSCCEQ